MGDPQKCSRRRQQQLRDQSPADTPITASDRANFAWYHAGLNLRGQTAGILVWTPLGLILAAVMLIAAVLRG